MIQHGDARGREVALAGVEVIEREGRLVLAEPYLRRALMVALWALVGLADVGLELITNTGWAAYATAAVAFVLMGRDVWGRARG